MWIAQGYFDQDPDHPTETKSKVLKPGCCLTIGRKNQPLLINSKRISTEHCMLSVAKLPLEHVSDPEKRPSLQVFNARDKSMSIQRNQELIPVNGKATVELCHGDKIGLAKNIMLLILWQTTCYVPHPTSSILTSCAALGINVVSTPHPAVDYHITALYTPTPEIGTSLLTRSNFVKLEWLEEIIELCSKPDSYDYVSPPLAKYRPAFSPSLDPKHKKFSVWEPAQKRFDLFRDHRFLCVAEKEKDIDSTLRAFIARGSGAIETFCASSGLSKWREALTRGTAKDATLVLVADRDTIVAAVGESCWQELCEEASRYQKRFFSTTELVQAVLSVDTTMFKIPYEDHAQLENEGDSALPDCVPNSIPEEMTVPPPQLEETHPVTRKRGASRQPSEEPDLQPSQRLTRRRAPSKEPNTQHTDIEDDPPPPPRKPLTRRGPPLEPKSSEPAKSQAEQDDIPPPPRKPLIRRVKAGVPVLTGLGDSSVIINAAVAASDTSKPRSSGPAQPMILDLTAPVAARSTRLKRRLGADSARSSSAVPDEPSEEPALKKFKALFEATNDPDQADILMSQLPVDDDDDTLSETQSGSPRGPNTQKPATNFQQTLGTISEDSQTLESRNSSGTKGIKRKATMDDHDVIDLDDCDEMPVVPSSRAGSAAPPSKRQAIENVNAVQPTSHKPPSQKKPSSQKPSSVKLDKAQGAPPGKPDTDPTFLKAVASTKRGKKTEDDFDREFNKLKISRPELDKGKENPEDEWAILDDFKDDQNIRGNFMVIVEMDVYKDLSSDKRVNAVRHPEWDGQPNFKKFKKKNIPRRSKKIELVISENRDHFEDDDLSMPTQKHLKEDLDQDSLKRGTARTQNRPLITEDSEEEFPVKPRKQKSRAGSTNAGSRRAAKSSVKSQPLFLDDDDDEVMSKASQARFSDIEEEDLDQTLPSTASTARSSRRTAAAPSRKPIIVDDDSDEDAFKGFRGRRRK
ncbi:hypothetical protein C8R42DRAFT_615611 [Lentinula raphanica]|nr:hypothetical protein C8R42DRAFT_615611 [Lentinula raphanica]